MAAKAITVAELRTQLADFPDDTLVWVLDRSSASGYSPALAVYPGADPDPAEGEPGEFAAIDVDG